MRRAITLMIGVLLAAAGFGVQAQTAPAPAKPAPAKPAAKQAANPPATQAAKPAATQAAKPAAKAEKPAAKKPKPAKAKAAQPKPKKAASTGAKPSSESEPKVVRRDPFESLIGRERAQAEAAKYLPPGIPGLQEASLRLDGVVKAPNGMIAVVTNPQQRTYFLREGDQLYDGRVEKISMDGVSFHEMGKDAFGKPVERQVNKRIYSSPGEQQ